VSYAPVFHNRVAAVVGDGELALRSALELARHGRLVYLLLPAHTGLDSALGMRVREAAHVTVLRGYRVMEVLGDEFARSLRIGGDGEERFLPIDGIFVEYELLPNSELVRGLAALDPGGRVRIDGRNRTSCAGLFAAGDVTNVYRERILVAVGEGIKAALGISDHLLYLETDRWGARPGDLTDGNGKWHPTSSPN
jgi:alkyl hydroperoxide reductase subunit F